MVPGGDNGVLALECCFESGETCACLIGKQGLEEITGREHNSWTNPCRKVRSAGRLSLMGGQIAVSW
jgi:hypothetical protein